MRGGTGPILILALVAIGVMLGVSLLQPVSWVRVVTAEGTLVACARVDVDTPIALTFTHSMFGGFVTERYRLDADGMLERQAMVTENAAAAEYYATDGRIRPVAGGYEVVTPPFATDRLVIRVDARGDHRLTVGGVTLRLYDQLGASTQVTLEGRRSSLHTVPRMCRTGLAAIGTPVTPTAQQGLWRPMRGQGAPGSAG